MSKIGIISQQYENAADVFHQFNNALILLKTQVLHLESFKSVSEREVLKARRFLALILKQILAGLNEDYENCPLIPPLFIRYLQQQERNNEKFYVKQIEELIKALQCKDEFQPLSEELIDGLDELNNCLDVYTTQLYQKFC